MMTASTVRIRRFHLLSSSTRWAILCITLHHTFSLTTKLGLNFTVNTRSVLAYVLALLGTSTTLEEPVAVPGVVLTSEYTDKVANHSASFHPNFSKNTPAGALTNGLLATPDVDLYFSGSSSLGRAAFVQALAVNTTGGTRAQFLDRLIIVEGNIAALLSADRITFNGSDARIETTLAETMIFDKGVLLSRIVSLSEGGLQSAQAAGEIAPPPLETIVRNPIANTSAAFTFKIKEKAAQFNINFNAGNASANGLLATENVTVVSDGRNSTGRASLVNLFTRYKTSVPDLLQHDEFIIGQGNWVATEYIFQGTRNGTFTMINRTKIAPNRAQYPADNDAFVNPLDLLNPLFVLDGVAPECIAKLPA
ncbi:hypothetical protein V8C35DRAFT_285168 [Trichoderma chlorosporum]